jgi:hypothetical protein
MSKGDETLLRRWDGAKAEIFQYGAGHREITIRLFRGGQDGQLRVFGTACLHICGPTEWDDARIEVSQQREFWTITDKKSGFTVQCRGVGVVEDRL